MTRAEALSAAAVRLAEAGVDDPRDEARRLLDFASDLSRAGLIAAMTDPMPAGEAELFEAALVRRARREPLSHILGSAGFWTLDLKVTPDVLTPRADTETVVEAALAAIGERAAPLRLIDIATGSGAIALALLSELPNATAMATDLSPAALAVARENAVATGLAERFTPIETCWADGVEGPFDLVVCNPPYIAGAVIDTLEPEVRDHEPRLALDGGPDGLDPYPRLFAEARRLVATGGTGVFEIGYDQGAAVLDLARSAGFAGAELKLDLAGRDRAVVFRA